MRADEVKRMVMALANTLAAKLKQLPEELREGWISYFLETCEREMGEEVLGVFSKEIEERIERGGW